jgi:hypothetical protein
MEEKADCRGGGSMEDSVTGKLCAGLWPYGAGDGQRAGMEQEFLSCWPELDRVMVTRVEEPAAELSLKGFLEEVL